MSCGPSLAGIAGVACRTAQAWSILLLVLAGLFVAGCDGRSYQRGYDDGYGQGYSDGYAEGYTNGHEVGYEKGFGNGFSAARPPGGELTGSAARWVELCALLGGLGLLALLLECAYVLVSADTTPDVALAKAGGIAVASVLAVIMIALGAHRLADGLLLAGRPESRLATFLLVLLAAAPAFVGAAGLRAVARDTRATQQQTLLVSLFAFATCLVAAVEMAMMQTPEPERYLFSYVALGLLLGMLAYVAFRLMRKAEGW